MVKYLAHSRKNGCPEQTYSEHITGVYRRAKNYAEEVCAYEAENSGLLKKVVQYSALLHDLGKLDDENQAVLHNSDNRHRHLPINHVDAGSAALKNIGCLYSATAVYAHHRGLPNIPKECSRNEVMLRVDKPCIRKHVDETLETLLKRFSENISTDYFKQDMDTSVLLHRIFSNLKDTNNQQVPVKMETEFNGDLSVFFRLILSCLADADHTDTASAYQQAVEKENIPKLCAKERLDALNTYVAQLNRDDERSCLRKDMYVACRDAKSNVGFAVCDSPVGSGKTTAVMAHLLQQAVKRKARRVFVILPYTSIIQEVVDTYRKALVLPGEKAGEVVAELHYRAEFEDKDTRYLTSLWRAPIVVTTSVAFFETIASNRPATLRRFHELPGSVIFIDEAHNALPLKLLPLAWRWMNILAEEWNCYWVLASGSFVRYWQLSRLQEIKMSRPNVIELVRSELKEKLMQYERNRITFRWKKKALSRRDLIEWVQSAPGPRLVILNTVQSAAVIANDLYNIYGRDVVEHLSSALTPRDRGDVIKRIKSRLDDESDTNWTLVATSCVEVGVDLSFRTGFRELSSLLSLLQAAGRVNRHGLYQYAEIWSFSLQDDSMLRQNPAFAYSREVLKEYFEKGIHISPELSTQSMNDEIIRNDSCIEKMEKLIEWEDDLKFPEVDKEFTVIDSDTVQVVVDGSLATAIACGEGNWKQLQQNSVSIYRKKVQEWKIKEIANGVYQWTLGYDSFLGYMRGVLNIEKQDTNEILNAQAYQ